MQFLSADENLKLVDLANEVGARNVAEVLVANQLPRVPDIGKKFLAKCAEITLTLEGTYVNTVRKVSALNTLTSDSEVYEKACLMSENDWKVFSTLNTFPDALRIPSSISVPSSANIIGNGQPVDSTIYQESIRQMQEQGYVNPTLFSDYAGGALGPAVSSFGTVNSPADVFSAFRVPWGQIQLYSSLSDESIDFPVYPEELDYTRVANYTTMQETLFQYEPWYIYESSGPREQPLTFKFHRDMWTGDHTDGKANELIRFCEACCYPDYNGASVITPTVTLYINGTAFIRGIMTQVQPHWTGPLGSDGWYLVCELTITINEVASAPLSYSSIRKMNVIGGYNE